MPKLGTFLILGTGVPHKKIGSKNRDKI